MQKYQNAIQDVHGNAVASATVTVYLYGTLTPAAIYSDNGLTVIPGSQVTTDSDGQFYFYADNGRYTLSVMATGFAQEQFSDVSLFDATDGGVVSVKDFATTADSATTVGTVTVPNEYAVTLPATFANTVYDFHSRVNLSVYSDSESGLRYGRRVYKSQQPGAHSGTQECVFGIEFRPTGSGANGAANADIGQTVSVVKKGYPSATTQGELDGLNVVVRQCGTASSDAAGILVDAANITGCGFLAAWESASTTFASGGVTVSKKIQSQIGVIDTVSNISVGFYADAETGTLDDGVRLRGTTGTGTWANYLHCLLSGVSVFKVDSTGRVVLTATSGATPSKTIRSFSGNFQILNDAQSTSILSLTDAGDLSIVGGVGCTTVTATTSVTAPAAVVNGIAQAQKVLLTATASAAGAGQVMLGNGTSATATAGAAGAPPAQVLGYLSAYLGGTQIKLPYYSA